MASHLAQLVYGSNPTRSAARAVMNGGRAVSPRSSVTLYAARPAQPSAYSTVAPGFVRVPHVGCPPWETGCFCNCHGDPKSSCDVSSCVDIL